MNQTFTKLAADFDAALQHYRDTEQAVKDAKAELNRREVDRTNAADAMRKVRDELLEAYPELVAVDRVVEIPTPAGDWQPPGPGMFTHIEVDDPDDVPDFRERA